MDIQSGSDSQLIALCKRGEEAAFTELYQRYKDSVLHYSWQMLRDYDATMDILQDTFRYIFRRLPTYRESGRFKYLLFKVVRNLCLNELKKRKKTVLTDFKSPDYQGLGSVMDDSVASVEMQQHLDEGLCRLPETFR